jgi:hypothetical protein
VTARQHVEMAIAASVLGAMSISALASGTNVANDNAKRDASASLRTATSSLVYHRRDDPEGDGA